MDLGLKDHVILISGGASGIGEAITRACLAEGAKGVIVSRVTATTQPFLDELEQQNLPCDFFEAELADPEACRAAIEFVQQKHGRLDGLVNNAGVNDGVGLASGDPARFMESLKLNLLHYYALAHYALPLLKASHGSIVNIASKVALTGQGNTSGYARSQGRRPRAHPRVGRRTAALRHPRQRRHPRRGSRRPPTRNGSPPAPTPPPRSPPSSSASRSDTA